MDAELFKQHKNRQLLEKMLALEQPVITPKMIDFLMQSGVCELLVSFVTRVSSCRVMPPSECG
jgi:hypothetical protein